MQSFPAVSYGKDIDIEDTDFKTLEIPSNSM